MQSLKERFGHVEVPVELARWNNREGRWGDYRDLHKATNIQADGEFGPCFSPHTPSELPIGYCHICERKKILLLHSSFLLFHFDCFVVS